MTVPFVYDSCMSKNITIDDDAYKTLLSLKEGPQDSFTKVIRRNLSVRLETAGELLDFHEAQPAPNVDMEVLNRVIKGRGRRSGGRR